MSDDERLVTPDDPEFEGAEYISHEAMIQDKIADVAWLNRFAWTWMPWSSDDDDHDHCVICHRNAFSESYDGDLREGWHSEAPAWDLPAWLCPACFDRFREHFDWRVSA